MKGRVRNYMREKYGSKAFLKNGNLKLSYLRRAKKKAKKGSIIKKALTEAINFKSK